MTQKYKHIGDMYIVRTQPGGEGGFPNCVLLCAGGRGGLAIECARNGVT